MDSQTSALEVGPSFRDRINLSGKVRRRIYEYLLEVRGNWYTLDFEEMLSAIAKNYLPIYKEVYRPQKEPSPEAVTLALIYLLAHQAKISQDFTDSAEQLFQFAKDFSEAASRKGNDAVLTKAWANKTVGISESEAGIIEGVCRDIVNTRVDYTDPRPTDLERQVIKSELSGIFPKATLQ